MLRSRDIGLGVIAAVLAVLVLSVLFVKSRAADPERYHHVADEILLLEGLDSDLDLEITEARYQLVQSYDPLISTLEATSRLQDQLGREGLGDEADPEIRRRLVEAGELTAKKQELIEDFVSENAVLRNSLGYFPIAADELIARSAGSRAEALVRDEAGALIRDVLLFNLHPSDELAASAEQRMVTLAGAEADLPPPAQRSLRRTLAHARSTLRHGPQADALLRRATVLPSERAYAEFFEAYRTLHERRFGVANLFRLALYAACVLLLAAVAFALWHLRRTALALRGAVRSVEAERELVESLNAELESRVASRTAELALANRQLSAASAAKSEFLANMSHEIRTPMGAVLGYADLLLDPELGAGERRGHVETIRRNGRHLLAVLNDILDLSKIEAGGMTVEAIATSLPQLVAEVSSLMRGRALEKGLSFSIEYLTPVPASLTTDPTRIRQILLNLTGNALKFTRTGGVRILIRFHEEGPSGPALSFEIVDTGIGMSEIELGRLFRPFSQADSSTTREFGGTGLGLAISRRLAAMLGGAIIVTSAPGKGSSFTLRLLTGPLEGVARLEGLREAGVEIAPAPRPSARAALHGNVLLAEDGPDNQRLIGMFLRKAGLTVTIVENGQLAVERALAAEAAGTPFDVVLIDMQMPVLDGYAAATILRAKGYPRPLIALTAHAMSTDRDKCLAAGCKDYLTKPVDRAALVATVGKHLPRRSAPPARASVRPAACASSARPGPLATPSPS